MIDLRKSIRSGPALREVTCPEVSIIEGLDQSKSFITQTSGLTNFGQQELKMLKLFPRTATYILNLLANLVVSSRTKLAKGEIVVVNDDQKYILEEDGKGALVLKEFKTVPM